MTTAKELINTYLDEGSQSDDEIIDLAKVAYRLKFVGRNSKGEMTFSGGAIDKHAFVKGIQRSEDPIYSAYSAYEKGTLAIVGKK